jgi:hypothetical protein
MTRRSKLRVPFIAMSLLVLGTSCGDTPTSVKPCELVALGPTLSYVVQVPQALYPALEDAWLRIIPALTSPPPEFTPSMERLSALLTSNDREARCTAFNIVAERFERIAAEAPASDGPDLESVRLVLRLTHAYLAAN